MSNIAVAAVMCVVATVFNQPISRDVTAQRHKNRRLKTKRTPFKISHEITIGYVIIYNYYFYTHTHARTRTNTREQNELRALAKPVSHVSSSGNESRRHRRSQREHVVV